MEIFLLFSWKRAMSKGELDFIKPDIVTAWPLKAKVFISSSVLACAPSVGGYDRFETKNSIFKIHTCSKASEILDDIFSAEYELLQSSAIAGPDSIQWIRLVQISRIFFAKSSGQSVLK